MSQEINQSPDETKSEKSILSTEEKTSFSDKTSRIVAISQFIKSITPVIWVVVILVIVIRFWSTMPIFGASSELKSSPKTNSPVTVTVPPSISTTQFDEQIGLALRNAHSKAETFANQELDSWVDDLIDRVDDDFLNWYFDYFTQLFFGVKGITSDVSSLISRQFNPNQPTLQEQKAENLTEEFQKEFANRVLRPEIAQLKLERFTRETINTYVAELSKELAGIQSEYKIPQADWERYLGGVSTTIFDMEGNKQNLSMRALSRGSGYLVAVPLVKATGKIGGGVAAKFAAATANKAAAKATTKLATKTAGKVAGKFSAQTLSAVGLNLIDPLAALGILAWDIWDNYHTAEVEKPIMREAILEYLKEVKMALLYNPQDSIMSAIYNFEGGIFEKIESSNS